MWACTCNTRLKMYTIIKEIDKNYRRIRVNVICLLLFFRHLSVLYLSVRCTHSVLLRQLSLLFLSFPFFLLPYHFSFFAWPHVCSICCITRCRTYIPAGRARYVSNLQSVPTSAAGDGHVVLLTSTWYVIRDAARSTWYGQLRSKTEHGFQGQGEFDR